MSTDDMKSPATDAPPESGTLKGALGKIQTKQIAYAEEKASEGDKAIGELMAGQPKKDAAWGDLDMLPAMTAAQHRTPPPIITVFLAAICFLFVFLIVWADFAELDEVAQGTGIVVPSQKLQIVQNLEGGILEELLVSEGEIVEKGQVLLRLDKTATGANYGEKRVRYLSLLATVARLEAELQNADRIDFPTEVVEDSPSLIESENRMFNIRRETLENEIAVLQSQLRQRNAEQNELTSKIERLGESARLLEKELEVTEPLVDAGAVSEIEVLRLRRSVNDLRGEQKEARLALPGAQAAAVEIRQQIKDKQNAFRQEASKDLSIANIELASIGEIITAEKDRVDRTDVRSPVHGIVQSIKIRTIGGVVQPGIDLVEIVPVDDSLLVEGRVKPADIAFIRPGLPAVVKLSAYDFAIYGGLEGKVERIGATSSIDERTGDPFFSILVRTENNHLGTEDKPLPIAPGMVATVDVITGKKTVMDYLLKPILRAKGAAMRER